MFKDLTPSDCAIFVLFNLFNYLQILSKSVDFTVLIVEKSAGRVKPSTDK
jgi:hypothetical protein